MDALIPYPFLFRFSFPIVYQSKLPGTGKKLLNLSAKYSIPAMNQLSETDSFAELRLAWNENGLGIAAKITPKDFQAKTFECDLKSPTTSDGLQLWIDTRNTQSIHRASRFCHHFSILPAGNGKKGDQPTALQSKIARAREDAPLCEPEEIQVRVNNLKTGYLLEAWLPATALNGFDPDASPKLGFFALIRDHRAGVQPLTVHEDFPVAQDPSLWSTLELIPA